MMMKVHFGLAKSFLLAGMMTLVTLANAQEGSEGESKSTEADNTPTPAAPAPAAPAGAKKGGEPGKKTEAGTAGKDGPRDSPYDRKIFKEKRVLTYDDIREADVFFEKRIWRVIDVREKINKPFVYPKQPFVSIIMDAAKQKEVVLYSTVDGDEFKTELTADEIVNMGASTDTVITYDPETYEEKMKIVHNELNPDDIKRFRLKEVWFFDKESSTLQTRVLGIAPIKEVKDDKGNFRFEQPMFWAYYPSLRQILSNFEAFNPQNDAQRMTWEDVFEMRLFSSYIMKESNVYDRRVQDYKQGIDILLEGENIKNTIFNFEHDLWTY